MKKYGIRVTLPQGDTMNAAHLLGENWEEIGAILKRYEYVVLAVLVVIVLIWLWFRFVKPWREGRRAAS